MDNNDNNSPPILYMIIPSMKNTFAKFIIVMIALVGFFVLLIYASLSDVKYIPNIHMFYDMLFDNFETSSAELISFIESVVENTRPLEEHFGNMSEPENLTVRKKSTLYENSYSSSQYVSNIISDIFTKTMDFTRFQFSKLITKSYVDGNVIRTTRTIR